MVVKTLRRPKHDIRHLQDPKKYNIFVNKANGLYVQIKERCTLQQQCKTGGLQLDTNNKVIIF
jgi:hypothetical protein